MRLLQTADWHIGKTLGEYSLLEEQRTIFDDIVQIAKAEQVDGIIIAGDLYDRAIAPIEAVNTLEKMLKVLNLNQRLPIYAVSGNHDGAVRLGAGREWRETTGLHLATTLADTFHPIETDEAQIYLLPYLDPIDVRIYFGLQESDEKQCQTINQAIQLVVDELVKTFHPEKKHILVTHYYVVNSVNQEYAFTSETNSQVGGLQGIQASQFVAFDYVALGHLHLREASPTSTIQYAGSPVKFNTKEANSTKGIYVLDITDAGVTSNWHPLPAHKDLIVLKNDFETLITPDFYQQYERAGANFFSIQLTKVTDAQNIRAQLVAIYGDVVEVQYKIPEVNDDVIMATASPEELSDSIMIQNFYQAVMDEPVSAEQEKLIDQLLQRLRREEE